MRHTYVIVFSAQANHGAAYEESIELTTPYNLSDLNEVENLFYLIHQEIRRHFSRYKILSVELVG